MSLEVIGAGLGRTGTLTLKLALEQLGLAPCHHMLEVVAHPEQAAFWCRAAGGEEVDWEDVFRSYRSAVDWPSAYFYHELAARYPEAKIILTVREPERWYASMSETILKVLNVVADTPSQEARFIDLIIAQNTFGRDLSKSNAIEAFERHNEEVRRLIPPDRLLTYDVAQGWGPLCDFFGLPRPDAPFPRANSREEFWGHVPT